jgi:hypothetical protein
MLVNFPFTLIPDEDIVYTMDNVNSIPEEGKMRHLKTTMFFILLGMLLVSYASTYRAP